MVIEEIFCMCTEEEPHKVIIASKNWKNSFQSSFSLKCFVKKVHVISDVINVTISPYAQEKNFP